MSAAELGASAASGEAFGGGRRLVFVGGSPRSGTTLVQNHLDAHPEIAGGPEYDNVPRIVELVGTLRRSVRSGRTRAFHDEGRVGREVGLLVERLLLPFADERGARLLSEKTPWNVLVFEALLELFPEARFVFCLRDPRAVVSSMLRVGERARVAGRPSPAFTRWLGAAVRCVRRCNRAGFAAARSERVTVLRYESLVRDPERETRRLSGFLGVPWDPAMLHPGRVEHAAADQVDGVWYTDRMYRADPDPARIDGWRAHLRPWQVAMVEEAFRGDLELRRLGYELGDAPLRARLASRVALGFSEVGGALTAPVGVRALGRRVAAELRAGGGQVVRR